MWKLLVLDQFVAISGKQMSRERTTSRNPSDSVVTTSDLLEFVTSLALRTLSFCLLPKYKRL